MSDMAVSEQTKRWQRGHMLPFMGNDVQPTPNELSAIAGECAAFNIRRASRTVTRLYAEALEGTELEPTQFSLLVACSRQPGVAISRLAGPMSMDRSALARNVAVLEKRGLLSVDVGQDRRVRKISITAAGRKKLSEALPDWRAAQSKLIAETGHERFIAFMVALRAMNRAAHRLLRN